MALNGDAALPGARRMRKSISAHSNLEKIMDKENATIDLAASTRQISRNKSRSKSLGPGGLDALKQTSGNRRASLAAPRSILKPRVSAISELTARTSQDSDSITSSKGRSTPNFGDEPTISKIALRTEEEQQAAAREARRKSLASRRVSFAAEATLHTFHEIDYFQEPTSSTDASRRESAATARDYTGQSQASSGYGPGTPRPQPYQSEDDTTSILYSSDSEPPDAVEEDIGEEEEDEDEDASSSDMEDGTMMTIEDVTGTTMGSIQSAASDSDESTLDEALRLAAQHAGTQRIESDGLDDGEEVIPSFGWVKKAPQTQQDSPTAGDEGTEMDMDMDMDMTTAMGRIINDDASEAGNEDMSMEVTKALGGILPQRQAPSEADAESDRGDATMEFTTAIGGIHHTLPEDDEVADHEEMSMELTTVLGGVLGNQKRKSIQPRRQTLSQMSDTDNTMDMTVGFGKILSNTDEVSQQEREEPENDGDEDDATMGMDMTVAMGGIIGTRKSPRSVRKSIMQEEADKPNSPKKAIMTAISKAMPSKRMSQPATAPVSPVVSSPLSVRAKPSRHSVAAPQRVTRSSSRTPSPAKSTPKRAGRASVGKRSSASPGQAPSQAVTAPTTTITPKPQRSSPGKKSQRSTPASAGNQSRRISASSHTPQRRLSGLGADRDGLGSPQVAEIMDRRSSIGDSASKFVPGKRRVSFGDPKAMAKEIERDEAEARSPRLPRPQEDRDATFNLREMIDSLSPARKPLNGRKSLHVGSAFGVLGKRPIELDDDEAEDNDGIKRLKGHQSSPVKNIRLPMPKADIAGKLTRLNLDTTSPVMTPSRTPPRRNEPVTSPRKQHWPMDNKANHTVHNVNLYESPSKGPDSSFTRLNGDQIHLQDFLDMTSIRFMELNTTKRRHTVAPSSLNKGLVGDDYDEMSLERCVVASACTVPRLELYQHSCRELKKYIAEGRRMVKEIEEDTFEDNPPLFKEYMTAPADVKALMDNQFKNVKTHARLLSKAMWYEWRMKLQEGLREGLVKISDDMLHDDRKLDEQQVILSDALPALISEYDALEEERLNLDEAAQELADCDPEELQETRDELVNVDRDIEEKKRQIQALREEYGDVENEAETLATQKNDCLADIARSEKIREDCRGWSSSEVNSLKDRVDALERIHGWAVTGVSGSTISMTYKRDIELVLDSAAFKSSAHSSPIDLWYIADSREKNPSPKSVEKEFFLQSIRDSIRSLPEDQADARTILKVVQGAWDEAVEVAAQISKINTTFQTVVNKTSDSSIDIRSTLLLVPLQSRVDITLSLESQGGKNGVDVTIDCRGAVVYGEHFNTRKIGEFLQTRIGNTVAGAKEDWSRIFVELHEKLIARGRK